MRGGRERDKAGAVQGAGRGQHRLDACKLERWERIERNKQGTRKIKMRRKERQARHQQMQEVGVRETYKAQARSRGEREIKRGKRGHKQDQEVV